MNNQTINHIKFMLSQSFSSDDSVVKGITWCELYAKQNINPSEWKPKQLAKYLVRQYLYTFGRTISY